MHALLLFITSIFLDTAITDIAISGGYEQSTIPIWGKNAGGFKIDARAIYDFNETSRVFGEVGYSWQKINGIKWVEVADIERLYPYLTCDTLGYDQKKETYYFYGGYRMNKSHFIWHVAFMFNAQQSYGTVDPRPKNKIAHLALDASLGYFSSKYAYSITLNGGRYKQNSSVSFYSDLGNNTSVFFPRGTSKIYSRFTSNYKVSYYHGATAGVGLQIIPKVSGFTGGIDYHLFHCTKELSGNMNMPIAKISEHAINVIFGHATPNLRVYLFGGFTRRVGTNYEYGEPADNTFRLITSYVNYLEHQWHIGIDGSYVNNLKHGKLIPHLKAYYRNKVCAEEYTSNNFKQLSDVLLSDQINATLSLQYVYRINKKMAWFISPGMDLSYYAKSDNFKWTIILSTGIKLR